MLGNSRCKVLSVLDLKDAFHSLRLLKNSKRYCGILPYFGSTSYFYQRMSLELNISPSVWQSYLNTILDCLQVENTVRQLWMIYYCSLQQKVSYSQIRRFIKSITQNGLMISPRKCQLFRKELQYMGNTIIIKDKRLCIKPL